MAITNRIIGTANRKLTMAIAAKLAVYKKASRRGGRTNQIPLTIKPYPMM
jgi:hypothetical protein